MYYVPMDFEELTLDGLIDTGALTSAISEQDLNKIKLLAPEAITDTGSAPNFQIMVAIKHVILHSLTLQKKYNAECRHSMIKPKRTSCSHT